MLLTSLRLLGKKSLVSRGPVQDLGPSLLLRCNGVLGLISRMYLLYVGISPLILIGRMSESVCRVCKSKTCINALFMAMRHLRQFYETHRITQVLNH
ncbi:hypothetical protein GDO78_003500 [Eleutherodactylus coqui]|uniref:Uncharacterized protein n=1 Tax=Eleutherodactylus coqui TaxID=57060 RepID=A0A8J6EUA9_ELECQ|nr:hypothetical protein GDO78_003500 [Eleutherodactylus coqui]